MLPKFIKNITVEDLQKDNIELYNTIFKLGEDSVKSECLNTLHILREGIKLNQTEYAEKCISENKTLEESISLMTAANKVIEENKKNFYNSAPVAAGAGSVVETPEIVDQKQAIDFVAKKYNLTNKVEIIKKARREFPNLFVSTFLKSKEEKN